MTESDFKVTYTKNDYDITDFIKNHPGGSNYINPFKNKEIANRMKDTQHSEAAYYLLREYQQGGRDSRQSESSEDLELLVDWTKPMLSQVASLGAKYKDWVILPVDRKLKLFGSPILESLTITPWYVVPLVWVPIITFFIIYGTQKYIQITNDPSPIFQSVLNVTLGIFLWTLIEYSLHRWVFHIEPTGKSKLMIYFHFAIHGLHHKVPFDTRRLVFPPLPAALITYAIYSGISLVVPESRLIHVVSGGLIGYLIYDMIHYYLHYGSPKENSYFYHLKRYHNHHHFQHHNSGFGISSVFWDKLLGTTIHLKKLAYSIKW